MAWLWMCPSRNAVNRTLTLYTWSLIVPRRSPFLSINLNSSIESSPINPPHYKVLRPLFLGMTSNSYAIASRRGIWIAGEATMKTRHLDKNWAQEFAGLDLAQFEAS